MSKENKDPFFEKLDMVDIDYSIRDSDKDIIDLVPANTTNNDMLEADIEYARDNLRTLITIGKDVLEETVELAKIGQNAKGFEVVARIMEVYARANKDLSDLSFQRRDSLSKEGKQKQIGDTTVNNTLIVGEGSTTADLLEAVKKLNG